MAAKKSDPSSTTPSNLPVRHLQLNPDSVKCLVSIGRKLRPGKLPEATLQPNYSGVLAYVLTPGQKVATNFGDQTDRIYRICTRENLDC